LSSIFMSTALSCHFEPRSGEKSRSVEMRFLVAVSASL
jgi:hypothetical protein